MEKLGNENVNYRSFKISSGSIEHHLMVMSIWTPSNTAREFRSNKKSEPSFGRSVGPKYGQHTTARSQRTPRYDEDQMMRQRNGYVREKNVNYKRSPTRYDKKQVRQNRAKLIRSSKQTSEIQQWS